MDKKIKRGRPVNEAMHAEIIAVAARLFMQLGLQATTMELIAKELGVSKLSLYSRFENKDALFSAVIEAKCKEYIPKHYFDDFHDYPMEEALYRVALGLLRLLISDDAINMERMLIEQSSHKHNLAKLFYDAGPARIKNIIAENLQQLNKEKKLLIIDPVFSAHIFCSLLKGSDIYLRTSMNIPSKPTIAEMDDYCRMVVKMFIKAHA